MSGTLTHGWRMVGEDRTRVLLERGGSWTAARVAALFGISTDYARVMLRALEKKGLAHENHGSYPQSWTIGLRDVE